MVFAILNADITTFNVALVTVGKDLHSDLEDLQWGLNNNMLAFGAFTDTLRRNMILPVVIALLVIVLMNDKLGTLKR